MSSLTYFTVVGNYFAAAGDGPYDAGDPRLVPMTGVITITPLVTSGDTIEAATLSPPTNLYLAPIKVNVKQGRIQVNGEDGVRLVANTSVLNLDGDLFYRVEFREGLVARGTTYPLKSFTFQAPSIDTTVDLVTVTPVAGSTVIENIGGAVSSVAGRYGNVLVYTADLSDSGTTGRALVKSNDQAAAWNALGVAPSANLPSYVDDVLEFPNQGNFPTPGETGKIYVALDTNDSFRWTGSTYIRISDRVTASGITDATTFTRNFLTTVGDAASARTAIDFTTGFDNRLVEKNVVSAGAKGDGTTDDTAAIHAARDAAGVGGTVIFPAGTYLTNNPNASVASQTWKLLPGAVIKMKTGSTNILNIAGPGVTIDGGVFDGTNATTTDGSQSGIVVQSGTNGVTIVNATVKNAALYGISGFSCNQITVRNCRTVNTLSAGIWIQNNLAGSSNLYDVTIANNVIDNSAGGGLASGIGLWAATYNQRFNRVQITGNKIILPYNQSSPNTGCVGPYNCNDLVVSDNVCVGGTISISCPNTVRGTITGNTVRGFYQLGIELPITSGGKIDNVTVSGNVVDPDGAGGFSGIQTSGGNITNLSITGNSIKNFIVGCNLINFGSGSVVTGLAIIGNTMFGQAASGTFSGVTFNGPATSVTMNGNVIDGGTSAIAYGMLVFRSITGLSITGNHFSNIANRAVYLGSNGAYTLDYIRVIANNYINCGGSYQSAISGGATLGSNVAIETVTAATKLSTARNIDGQSFDGTTDITVIAPGTHAATSKTTPVDADELPIVDSAASNVLKKLTWANIKATLFSSPTISSPTITGTPVGISKNADVQVFTGNGTWTKPANAVSVNVLVIGPGAGGGAGARGPSGTALSGGAGGSGGAWAQRTFVASDLPSTLTVTVGAGGAGAPGQTVDGTAGANGSLGSNGTSVASGASAYLSAGRGNVGGGGGLAVAGAASSTTAGMFTGGAGGAGSATGGAGAAAASASGAPGGGAGGGITAGASATAGGAGGTHNANSAAAGTAGSASNGGDGGAGPVKTPGAGGGGGGGNASGAGYNGGKGGNYGAGGGGGGASLNGSTSGAGGNGGDGLCVVTTYF